MFETASIIASVILGALGWIALEKKRRSDAESALDKSLFANSEDILSYRQNELSKRIAEEKQKLSEIDKAKIAELNPEQVEKYWQDRFKK